MLSWLFPSTANFFSFFEEHASQAVLAAKLLQNLMADMDKATMYTEQIRAIEHQADTITHNCIETLHKTFITPFDREQIHELISDLDDIVDAMEEAAAKVVLYRLSAMTAEAQKLAQLLVLTTQEVHKATQQLTSLKNTAALQHIFQTVNRLEKEADMVMRQALSRLFDEEHDPLVIMKWKEIYEGLENTIDKCEDVANLIEGVILEND